ncbi:MAG: DUF4058 family protein [Akkermansiaceae bacterium]|nr:DUF4058 family protein [Armatimonadota bacterium]
MPSPFPGMDPYVEERYDWSTVHASLITRDANGYVTDCGGYATDGVTMFHTGSRSPATTSTLRGIGTGGSTFARLLWRGRGEYGVLFSREMRLDHRAGYRSGVLAAVQITPFRVGV